MKKFNIEELEISFNMVKQDGKPFTEEEIDKFNDEFIQLVEKYNYLVGGSIGPYIEHDEDGEFDEFKELYDFEFDDVDSQIDPDIDDEDDFNEDEL